MTNLLITPAYPAGRQLLALNNSASCLAQAPQNRPWIAGSSYHATAGPLPQLFSPFQAALLFTAEKKQAKPGRDAFVCYLNGKQVIAVERLHGLRGHNPAVNLTSVLSRAKRNNHITGVILATWEHSTAEHPYALEFVEEVERQHELLLAAGIRLIDNLRLSETGVYSFYGDQNGPYCDSPAHHEKSICRLY